MLDPIISFPVQYTRRVNSAGIQMRFQSAISTTEFEDSGQMGKSAGHLDSPCTLKTGCSCLGTLWW